LPQVNAKNRQRTDYRSHICCITAVPTTFEHQEWEGRGRERGATQGQKRARTKNPSCGSGNARSDKAKKYVKEENKATRELDEARHKADDDAKKRHEQARLKHELERRRQEDLLDELQRKKEALVETRCKEEANQIRMKKMGIYVQGYRWIHQSSGYRCAGGSHWVSDAQLGNS
jgi:hypothetical protein